jgi:hypothetical protein
MKVENWWLGGDPNCDCHKMLRNVGLGLIPQYRERERIQNSLHARYDRMGLPRPCTIPPTSSRTPAQRLGQHRLPPSPDGPWRK